MDESNHRTAHAFNETFENVRKKRTCVKRLRGPFKAQQTQQSADQWIQN